MSSPPGQASGQGSAREGWGGYLFSAFCFALLAAVWAVMVRDDPYYRATNVFGAHLPAALILSVTAAPVAGFAFGRWRYDRPLSLIGAIFAAPARLAQAVYAHALLVAMTVAAIAVFANGATLAGASPPLDTTALVRWAPWIAAYVAGFNLGRAATLLGGDKSMAATATIPIAASAPIIAPAPAAEPPPVTVALEPQQAAALRKPPKEKAPRKPLFARSPKSAAPDLPARIEPAIGDLAAISADIAEVTIEPAPAKSPPAAFPAVPTGAAPTAAVGTGFLPPQDFDRLRPTLAELR